MKTKHSACTQGSTCDISHDPALCPCNQCQTAEAGPILAHALELGDVVKVGPRFVMADHPPFFGNHRFESDEWTDRVMRIVRFCGVADLELAPANLVGVDGSDADVIIHHSRLTVVPDVCGGSMAPPDAPELDRVRAAAAPVELFCFCGKRRSECDGSRLGCPAQPERKD